MVSDRLIDETTAIKRVSPDSLNHLLMPQIEPKQRQKVKPVAQGISASPGAAVGKVVLSAEEAVQEAAKDPKVRIMLVRKDTSPEDVAGMHLAQGILTSTGGKASHAAVVARGWGKPCVVGCEAITIDEAKRTITVKGQTIKAGDYRDHRRHDRRGLGRRDAHDRPDDPGRILHADGMGRQGPHPQGPHQRRHARRTPPRPASSAPRGSGSAGPSTCSSASSGSSPCGR